MSQGSEEKKWNTDTRAEAISRWMAESTPLNQSVGVYFRGRARKIAGFFLTNLLSSTIDTLKAERIVDQRP